MTSAIPCLDEAAGLCLAPFGQTKPTVFRGAVRAPAEFFGEEHILEVLGDPRLRLRAGLFRGQTFVSPDEQPQEYTLSGILRNRAAGASLTLRGLQRLHGQVRDACMELTETGWSTVHAVGQETPVGDQSLPTHWDLNPVVAVQCQGRKTWVVYRPIPTITTAEAVIAMWGERVCGSSFTPAEMLGMTPDQAADVVTLEPGDAYFVPAGWAHAPVAVDGTSVHVSICPLPQVVVDEYGNEDHFLQVLQAS